MGARLCSLSCKQLIRNTLNEDDGTDVWAGADWGLARDPRDRPDCGGCRSPVCASSQLANFASSASGGAGRRCGENLRLL